LGGSMTYRFIGDIHRGGNRPVQNEEFTLFVGDIRLDLTQAQIAPGETRLRFSGFVGDITLIVPAGVGVSITSAAFVTDLEFLGQHRSAIFTPMDTATPGYAAAERRLRLEVNFFVLDLNIHPG
jgi:lia operon protein LiaF